jgi:hypothetical protein
LIDYFQRYSSLPKKPSKAVSYPSPFAIIERCPQCRGAEYWEYFYCPDYLGYGRVESKREFSLAIPPHVRDGTEAQVSPEDIGLKNSFLNVAIRIIR